MPNPAAALRVNIPPMRMYLASISGDLWPVWPKISRSLIPFIAMWVTWLARSEWPPKGSGFKPALCAARFKIQPMRSLWRPRLESLPWRMTIAKDTTLNYA